MYLRASPLLPCLVYNLILIDSLEKTNHLIVLVVVVNLTKQLTFKQKLTLR